MDNDITVVFRFKDDFTLPKMKECLIPTQDAKPSFGLRPKDGFVSKWVYNFWPAKNLCTYQAIHIGGGMANSKNTVQNPLNPRETFFGD